jgi:hypothetical protein
MKEIAQHGGGLSVQQQQQAGQGAAAAGLGAAAVSAAAAAAAGAADAAAPKEQVKGIKAWGKQPSFAAFWGWWQSAPPGFSDSRAELDERKDFTWREGDRRQLVSELHQFLSRIKGKKEAIKQQLGGVAATDEQAVAALDIDMQEQGLKNLAAYHKKFMKSPYATGAKSSTAAAGEGAEAAAEEGAAAGASSAPAAVDRAGDDAGAGTAAARRGAKRGMGGQTSNSSRKKSKKS